MRNHHTQKRTLALTMAMLMTAISAIPAAAVPIGSGVTPTYDEAYYATLDYYGNLVEGSVVKSYALNGASAITDYGVYDEVINLTDGTPARMGNGTADFQFSQSPSHFYFEGRTREPFQNLPWTISLRYTLNGVPARAEELAGQKGVVEILLDIIPNENASDYARYNYTLEAMALFNQDDILSLEAPGAQVQLVGNLRTVLFMALPGEEEHFTIRVGSDDFSFGGMTILMVPATLGQLEEIAKLSQRKDELEEDYQALSGSLDAMLDAMEGIKSGLYASASGLDQLDIARGTISGGKGTIYEDAGILRGDLSGIADMLEPVEQRVMVLSQTVADSKVTLNELTDTAVSLKGQLDSLEKSLKELEKGSRDIKYFMRDVADLEDSLDRLERALRNAKVPAASSNGQIGQMVALHNAFEAANEQKFFEYLLTAQGDKSPSATAAQMFQLLTGYNAKVEETFNSLPEGIATKEQVAEQVKNAMLSDPDHPEYQVLPTVLELDALFQAKKTLTFKNFCATVLKDAGKAEQIDQLWQIYSEIDSIQADLSSTLSTVTKPTADLVGELADLCGQLDDLSDYLDDAKDLTAALGQVTGKLNSILDNVDSLRGQLNAYEPTLQEGLTNMGGLTTAATTALRNMERLLDDTERLMQTSGNQLDTGTRQTLRGLSQALRQTAAALDSTGDVRDAKETINNIIEDTWHEYTGDINNILMMDAEAEAVSLTDPRNPTPSSVQILIRTQEIKVEDEEEKGMTAEPLSARTAAAEGPTTFWGRVAQMFQDLWRFLTGIFR